VITVGSNFLVFLMCGKEVLLYLGILFYQNYLRQAGSFAIE
jgi:hypothetical protein